MPREHADEADRGGRLPEAVVTALRDAGLPSLQVPRALGGPGADFRTAFDVDTEPGRGCGTHTCVAVAPSRTAGCREIRRGPAAAGPRMDDGMPVRTSGRCP
ncbi:acyl-CoA dehydrogenase family protein [Streptomyces olivaceoviridis]|uniref:acyl-CoA dehydrogenase family protein n=1 Tax=Streptomyces olivaceoviridis TaxID=1921 RepID=UPI003702D8AC